MKRRIVQLLVCALISIAAPILSVSAKANVLQVYELEWSGAGFGNSATASGFATLDITLFNLGANPGSGGTFFPSIYIPSISITVAGAATGNGTFGVSNFSSWGWSTNGATLDLSQELVGQATSGSPWGTLGGTGGDFNLFGIGLLAPSGTSFFRLTTAGGTGQHMQLTSFAPIETPLPAALPLFATGLGLMGLLGWRRKRRMA